MDLEFTEDALVEIAKESIRRKTGARGLRAIMEEIIEMVRKISEDIAKTQGYTAVLDCSAFLYISADMKRISVVSTCINS